MGSGVSFERSTPAHMLCLALPTETKVESGDVSKQKWNLCELWVTVENSLSYLPSKLADPVHLVTQPSTLVELACKTGNGVVYLLYTVPHPRTLIELACKTGNGVVYSVYTQVLSVIYDSGPVPK